MRVAGVFIGIAAVCLGVGLWVGVVVQDVYDIVRKWRL